LRQTWEESFRQEEWFYEGIFEKDQTALASIDTRDDVDANFVRENARHEMDY
jgi:hypothetical protein